MKNYLDKNTSLKIHGIAILMLIYHHLFLNGNTWYVNNPTSILSVFDFIQIGLAPNAQQTFAWFCRVCVSLFAFTSGYAMYQQFTSKVTTDTDLKGMYSYVLKRLWTFYKKYFLVFLFFSSCEYFMGDPDGLDFSLLNYLLNLVGLSYSFNTTWWYVSQYYLMVLLSPLVFILLKKIKIRDYFIIAGVGAVACIIALLTGNITPFLKGISGFIQQQWFILLLVFMEGMFTARYNWVNLVCDKLNLVTSLILLIVTYLLRVILVRAPSDPLFDLVLIVPLVISMAKVLSYTKVLSKVFEFFGKYSTYMWFVHSYFYALLFFTLVKQFDLSLLVFIQVVFLSLVSSIAFTFVEKTIDQLIHKKISSQ